MKTRYSLILTAFAILLVAASAMFPIMYGKPEPGCETDDDFYRDTIVCIIATDRQLSSMEFSTGFTFEILSRFADHFGKSALIILERDLDPDYIPTTSDTTSEESSNIRSVTDDVPLTTTLSHLLEGDIDIVAANYSLSIAYDPGLHSTPPFADGTCWIIAPQKRVVLDSILSWQANFCHSKEYNRLCQRFTPSYNPARRAATGRKFAELSPYDSLITAKADELGWPRTLLTSLIWNESHFHIEAQSRRGAAGLMQLMPRTAGRFNISNPIDPEENLNAGIAFLKRLERFFAPYTSDSDELRKFAIAAYNAGEGRMKNCMLYASSIGAPHSTWDDIKSLLPQMMEDYLNSDDVDVDSLSTTGISRKPLSRQTVAYVESIIATDALLKQISAVL